MSTNRDYILEYDCFSLKSLYEQAYQDFFAVRPPDLMSYELNYIEARPDLLNNISYCHRQYMRNINNTYTEALDTLLASPGIIQGKPVPILKGFYLFIRNDSTLPVLLDIYIGIAGKENTDRLRDRLREHLLKTEVFIWSSIYGNNDALTYFNNLRGYPGEQKSYTKKSNSTHVLWVGIDGDNITKNDLLAFEELLRKEFAEIPHNKERKLPINKQKNNNISTNIALYENIKNLFFVMRNYIYITSSEKVSIQTQYANETIIINNHITQIARKLKILLSLSDLQFENILENLKEIYFEIHILSKAIDQNYINSEATLQKWISASKLRKKVLSNIDNHKKLKDLKPYKRDHIYDLSFEQLEQFQQDWSSHNINNEADLITLIEGYL